MTPFQLGYKSVMVNISDVVASGAEIKYLTIALSLPKNIDKDFVEKFYQGAKSACPKGVEIVGGDITGSDKVFISICALGNSKNRRLSSRKNAKAGYKVVVQGIHGSSAIGLNLLLTNEKTPEKFIKAHLEPVAQVAFGEYIGANIKQDYAMMDTSDGLMDALSTIANESGVLLNVDFDKIPYDRDIQQIPNWENSVLFGGEDYGIVAVLPKDFDCGGTVIGEAVDGLGVDLKINGKTSHFTKDEVDKNLFNHFGGN
jgi:thiamine-monophosphate kinase